jgi:large subunit ribosomal protein L22
MSQYNYTFKNYVETMARVVGRDLPISTKQSIEICKYLRGMELEKAKETLERVLAMKEAVPFTRFTEGAGHKRGIGAGKYPIHACTEILKLLKSVESNSQNKGLGNTKIIHISAQRAGQRWHYGRKRRRMMKRTHVEIVVEEIKGAKKPKKGDKKGDKIEERQTEKAEKQMEEKKALPQKQEALKEEAPKVDKNEQETSKKVKKAEAPVKKAVEKAKK